jgi:hypothetical protein
MANGKGSYYLTSNKDGVRISRQITEAQHASFSKQLEDAAFTPLAAPTPQDPNPPPGAEDHDHESGFTCQRCKNGRFVLGNGEPRTCNTCGGTGWISEARWFNSTLPYIRRCLAAGSIDALTLANAIEGCVRVFGATRPPRGMLHVGAPAIVALYINECEGLYNATKGAAAASQASTLPFG